MILIFTANFSSVNSNLQNLKIFSFYDLPNKLKFMLKYPI